MRPTLLINIGNSRTSVAVASSPAAADTPAVAATFLSSSIFPASPFTSPALKVVDPPPSPAPTTSPVPLPSHAVHLPTPNWLHDPARLPLPPDLPDDTPALIACVVPAARAAVLARLGNRPVTWVDAALVRDTIGIDFSLVDATTIGADRLANAVAAVVAGPLPAVVLDTGTAITTTVIDAERRFRGGAILPGRKLLRDALHTGTGQLPFVDFGSEPPGPLGTNTRDAIRAGCDLGILGAVTRLLETTRLQLGRPDLIVLAVGGDATYFAHHVSEIFEGPGDFTLRGLAAIAAARG